MQSGDLNYFQVIDNRSYVTIQNFTNSNSQQQNQIQSNQLQGGLIGQFTNNGPVEESKIEENDVKKSKKPTQQKRRINNKDGKNQIVLKKLAFNKDTSLLRYNP